MRKPAELRKAEIISTVLQLADRIGPDRVTTTAAASEIGISQAALFRHFPTKAQIWLAVADHVGEELTAGWQQALTATSDPISRLKALVAAQLKQIAATPALPMLLFSRELNVGNDDLRIAFHKLLLKFQGLIIAELTQGQAEQSLRDDLIAADAALLVISLVQGMAIRWSLGARDFSLVDEGLRLFTVQLQLLAVREG